MEEKRVNQKEFDMIQGKIKNYRYSSMMYLGYEEVKDYEILVDNDKVILLYGFNTEGKRQEYYWAANSAKELLGQMKEKENRLVSFVPKEWQEEFKEEGFEVYSIWNDYFRENLEGLKTEEPPELLKLEECNQASKVTLSCRLQSRGFTGQTENWFRQWLTGEEDSAVNTGTKDNAVIIHRDSNNTIVGVLCTAVYGHESPKGPILWVREVAVIPEYQNRGIARKLILQALSYGKSHGATRAFLAADECNNNAIHLYESLGFVGNPNEAQIDMIGK